VKSVVGLVIGIAAMVAKELLEDAFD